MLEKTNELWDAWVAANPDIKGKERAKQYHIIHNTDPEYRARRAATQSKTKAERDARYRENNRQRLNQESQEYRDANKDDPLYKEKRKEYCKKFYDNHTEERLAYGKQYKEENAEAVAARTKEYRSSGIGKEKLVIIHREGKLRTYGLNTADVEKLKQEQDNKCAICGDDFKELDYANPMARKTTMSIDHDHKTGKVRGLLCNHCNIGLGYFKDNPAITDKASAYLRQYQATISENSNPVENDNVTADANKYLKALLSVT